jgi:hypothetical protein
VPGRICQLLWRIGGSRSIVSSFGSYMKLASPQLTALIERL